MQPGGSSPALAAFAEVFRDDAFRERFEVLEMLGQGGMGALFTARDRSLDRRVALKMTRVTDERSLQRFEREGRVLARVSHPRVLKVFSAEVFAKVPVLVMELLEGVSLAADLVHTSKYSLGRAVDVIDQVLDGLDAVHALGIVHRDLKPGNVLCLDTGIKLIDFGLARSFASGGATAAITIQGDILGTPAYMAPEQCQGTESDARTDLYAAGVMLFEMLAGRLPFQAPSAFDLIDSHLRSAPPLVRSLVPDLPPGVEVVIQRALAKRPRDRFADARQMRDALAGASRIAGPPTGDAHATLLGVAHGGRGPSTGNTVMQTRSVGPGAPGAAKPAPATHRWRAGVTAAACVMIAMAMAVWRPRPAPPRRTMTLPDTRASTAESSEPTGPASSDRASAAGPSTGPEPAEFEALAGQLVPALNAIPPEEIVRQVERFVTRGHEVHCLEDLARLLGPPEGAKFAHAAHLLRQGASGGPAWLSAGTRSTLRDAVLEALFGLQVVDAYMQRRNLKSLAMKPSRLGPGAGPSSPPSRWDFSTGVRDLLPTRGLERTLLSDAADSPLRLVRKGRCGSSRVATVAGQASIQETWTGEDWCAVFVKPSQDIGERGGWNAGKDFMPSEETKGQCRTGLEIGLVIPDRAMKDCRTATLQFYGSDLGESVLWVSINGHRRIPLCAPRFDGALGMFSYALHLRQFPPGDVRGGRNTLTCKVRPYPLADKTTPFFFGQMGILINEDRIGRP